MPDEFTATDGEHLYVIIYEKGVRLLVDAPNAATASGMAPGLAVQHNVETSGNYDVRRATEEDMTHPLTINQRPGTVDAEPETQQGGWFPWR